MTRVSPPDDARELPGPQASIRVTRAPRRNRYRAVHPPNAPAPITATWIFAICPRTCVLALVLLSPDPFPASQLVCLNMLAAVSFRKGNQLPRVPDPAMAALTCINQRREKQRYMERSPLVMSCM